MDAIFQQAQFDDKKDLKRIEGIAKEVECGHHRNGFARVLDGKFICVHCLIKDAVDRWFKEADK